MPVAPTSVRAHAISLSSDRVLLRPHRCDDCMASSHEDHPPYCGPSCFEHFSSNLDSACGSLMTDHNASPSHDYTTSSTIVAGGEFSRNICVECSEAVSFISTVANSGNSTKHNIDDTISEEINRPASVLQPLAPCSLPPNPAEWLSLASWSDQNVPEVSNFPEGTKLLWDEQEAMEHTDLYELPPADTTSLLASYRDFILYGEQDCFKDLESSFLEQACVITQTQDDRGSISDDEDECYCGYCRPFLLQDGVEQQENLWIGDSGVASAA